MGGVFSYKKSTPDGLTYYSPNDITVEKMDIEEYATVSKGYAKVSMGATKNKRAVAVKLLAEFDTYFKEEKAMLKKHTHPNVVEIFGVIWDKQSAHYSGYVMEYMELGSLHNEIHDPAKFYDFKLITKWIFQIAEGLDYLHGKDIIHRNIKPKNILLAARDHLKLADFGLVKHITNQNTSYADTKVYMAPEVLASNDYDESADVYSFGVTIWEIINRKNPSDHVEIDSHGNVELPAELNNNLEEIVKRCLQKSVFKRATICEVRNFAHASLHTILIIGGDRFSTGRSGINGAILTRDRSRWIELQLKLPRFSSINGAVYLNGEIYTFGKFREPAAFYKLDKNLKWIRLADMNIGRTAISNSCVVWNGYIWVFGGIDAEKNRLKSVERYDPKKNKWKTMQDMIHPRAPAAALWDGGIAISGNPSIKSVECFSPEDGSWEELPDLPTGLSGHCLISYKEKLIVMGGDPGINISDKVWELNYDTAEWQPLPSMKYFSKHFAGIVFDEEIYAIGGSAGYKQYRNRVEIFDGEEWRDGPQLPCGWSKMSAMIIPKEYSQRLCKLSNQNKQ